jgi:hypothetical protein
LFQYTPQLDVEALNVDFNKNDLIDFTTLKENLAVIDVEIKNGENTNVETKEFKGLNHLFQKSETGDSREYRTDNVSTSSGVH